MLKKLGLVISITLAMVLGVALVGCSDSETGSGSSCSETEITSEVASVNELVLVGHNDIVRGVRFYTFYDPDTYVMYKLTTTGYIEGGVSLTVMVNPDGTPRLYEP